MAEELRLLDHHSDHDIKALHKVLDHLVDYESSNKLPARSVDRIQEIVNFHKSKFNPEHVDDIIIGAHLIDGTIVDVWTGFKLHLLKGFPRNLYPVWFNSIWYSTYHENKSPMEKKTKVGILVTQKMEEYGYYTWYNCMKFPNYHTEEECAQFVNKFAEKRFNQSRYITHLEYVLWKDQNVADIPFDFYKGILQGATHNKNMCLLSHHLKPEYRKFMR